jgi:hypothetical protein
LLANRIFNTLIMKLKCRLTHAFADLKIDEVETTVYKSDPQEIERLIDNLTDVIDDLAKLMGKDFRFSLTDAE